MGLREKIAVAICDSLPAGVHDAWADRVSKAAAEAILAIPEIAEALGRSYKGIPIVEDETLKRGQFTMTPPSHRISTAD